MNQVLNLQPSIERLENENARLKSELTELTAKYEWLLEKYKLRTQKVFGRSREQVDGQIVIDSVFDEAEATADPSIPDPVVDEETKTVTYRRKRYPGQKADKLSELPVFRIYYELPVEERSCARCGKALPELAPAVSRRLEVIPAQVKVIESVRHIYADCTCEESDDGSTCIINAPMPEPAIPHSIATESAVAFVMTQKYQFGLPLYRQEQQWKLLDIEISRQTMANWIIAASELWLNLIYERMRQLLLTRDILCADETTLQVLHEKDRPSTSKSYMWLFRSGRDGPPIVLFDYQTTRAAKHPFKFLKGFSGYLCTDGYAAYYSLPGVSNVSCWSHARRKFDEALKAMPKTAPDKPCLAKEGFSFCNQLFAIERKYHDVTPEDRFKGRLLESQPVLDTFKNWLERQNSRVAPKTHLGMAIKYCLNLWPSLCAFIRDGRLEIDNNRSERSIKMFVIGRKGWLFSNTPKGATASAIAYSVIETAKENGLKPFEYLCFLLRSLPNSNVKDQSVLDNLLPWSDTLPDSCRAKR